MKRLVGKLSYANVISTICLFLLLGGGAAYAAAHVHLGKNAVGVNQLKKNSVTNAKLKKDAVTGGKVKDGSLTGADVKDGSLSGADIDQATLTSVRASNVTSLLVSGKECAPITPFPAGVSAERTSEGTCKFTFPASVIDCAAEATPHFRLASNELIIVQERSIQVSSGTATPNLLATSTYEEGEKKNYPFDLVLVC